MSIAIQCSNGHRLVARDEIAGKRVKCPKCGEIIAVPIPIVEEVLDLSLDDLVEDSPTADNPFESLPEFSADATFPTAHNMAAFPAPGAAVQPSPGHLAALPTGNRSPQPANAGNPAKVESDENWLTPPILATGIASAASLILGLLVLGMLLMGRGDHSNQLAQAIPAPNAFVSDDVTEAQERQTQESLAPTPTEFEPVPLPVSMPEEQQHMDVANAQPPAQDVVEAKAPSEIDMVETLHSIKFGTNANYVPIVAFDQRTGDVALVNEKQQMAIYRKGFFEGDETAISRLESKFDDGAKYLVFKPWKDRTLLLASDGQKVWIYEAQTGKLFDKPNQIANPILVSRPGLYSSESPRDERFFTAASEVLLRPYTEERPITDASTGMTMGVSPSGRMIFGQFPAFAFPATLGNSQNYLGHARKVSHLPMDPTDQYWFMRDKFMKWDGEAAVRSNASRDVRLSGNLLAYVPDSPWTIFSTEEGLSLVHRVSHETRKAMPIPSKGLNANWNRAQHQTLGYVDAKNNRFLLVTADTLASIPLNKLNIPAETLLGVQVGMPPVVQPGATVEATVHAAPGVEVSLQDAPDGAVLNGNQLSWTPSYDQIGPQNFVFRCKAGADLSDQKVAVVVSQLGVDLPFSVSRSFLSEDGSQALAVSAHPVDDQHRFAIIDTNSLEFRINPEPIAGTVRHGCFDRSEIYLLMDTYELHVFDATTLQQKSRHYYGLHNQHLRGRRTPAFVYDDLRLLDDKLVIRNEATLTYFDRNDLSVTETVEPIDDPGHPAWTLTAEGDIRFGPALYGEDGKFHRLLQFPNLIDVRGRRVHDSPLQFDSFVSGKTVFGGTTISLNRTAKGISLGKGSPTLIHGNGGGDSVLSAAGECISIRKGGALVLVHPYQSGLLPKPGAPEQLPLEKNSLKIVGKGLPMVVSGQRDTKFEFEISGGTAPYHIKSEIKDIHRQTAFQLDERTGIGMLDGAALTQAITQHGHTNARRVQGMLSIPEVHGRDLADAIKSYRELASKTCSRYSKVTFKEFPVSVSLNISISDSQGKRILFQHMFALEVPVKSMLASIGDTSRLQIRDQAEDSGVPIDPRAASGRPTPIVADFASLNAVEISPSTGDLRKDYFEHLRRFQLDDGLGELSLKHRALVHRLPKSGRSLHQRTPIELGLANRESVTGTVTNVTRSRIAIQTEEGGQDYFPYQFDPDSLRQLYQISAKTRNAGQRTRDQAEIAAKIKEFRWRNGFLLPNSLDGPDGTPLLSWRVLLLPSIGYTELFSLFRLNEPWDSEHNRQLIPCMPVEYGTDPDAAVQGLTPLEILSGEQTLFPPGRLIRNSSIGHNQFRSHVIGIIKQPELASEWTKPSDIRLTEDKLPYEMIQPDDERSSGLASLFTYDLGVRKMGPIPGQKTDTRRRSTLKPEPQPVFITDVIRQGF